MQTSNNSVYKIKVKRGNLFYISSCVFIDPYTALTAAHSVFGAQDVWVDNKLAKKFILHPMYDVRKSNYLYDLAVLKFEQSHSHVDISYSISSTDNFSRVGYGLRGGKNESAQFDVRLIDSKSRYILFEDEFSVVGDSGGGIFNNEGSLVATHSTKEKNYIYTQNLSFFKSWITPYKGKYNQSLHLC